MILNPIHFEQQAQCLRCYMTFASQNEQDACERYVATNAENIECTNMGIVRSDLEKIAGLKKGLTTFNESTYSALDKQTAQVFLNFENSQGLAQKPE